MAAAIEYVYDATCKRFPGCCPFAIRYCNARCRCAPCGCRCGAYVALELQRALCYPLRSVDRIVVVDAAGVSTDMDPAEWRIDPPGLLIRNDNATGHGSRVLTWPPQNVGRPVGQPGTWWIEGTMGCDPPSLVLQAASDLACEFIKSCEDPDECSLPDGVDSISRRGTTISFRRPDLNGENPDTGVPKLNLAISRWGCKATDYEYATDPYEMSALRRVPKLWYPIHPDQLPTPIVTCPPIEPIVMPTARQASKMAEKRAEKARAEAEIAADRSVNEKGVIRRLPVRVNS